MGETVERKLKDYKGFAISKITDNKGLSTEETTYLAYLDEDEGIFFDGEKTLTELKKKIDNYVD